MKPDSLCACATARRMARMLTQLYDHRLRSAGMEAPQFALLSALECGPLSQADLGRRHALDKTTVSRNLRVLEGYGWIEESAAVDKRKREFALTRAGRNRLAVARPEWQKAQSELRIALTDRQWKKMFRVFQTVTDAAQSLSR